MPRSSKTLRFTVRSLQPLVRSSLLIQNLLNVGKQARCLCNPAKRDGTSHCLAVARPNFSLDHAECSPAAEPRIDSILEVEQSDPVFRSARELQVDPQPALLLSPYAEEVGWDVRSCWR
jgi:hypothetical protein